MKEFFDTSVLVAAFRGGHVHHVTSLKLFAAAEKSHSACGLHSLAEVYSVMTALPVKPMIPPEQALLFVEEVRNRLTPISLSAEEYFVAIQDAASRGLPAAAFTIPCSSPAPPNAKPKPSIPGISSTISPLLPPSLPASKPLELRPSHFVVFGTDGGSECPTCRGYTRALATY